MPIFQSKVPKLNLPAYSNAGFGTVSRVGSPDDYRKLTPAETRVAAQRNYTGSLAAPPPKWDPGVVTANDIAMQNAPKDPITGSPLYTREMLAQRQVESQFRSGTGGGALPPIPGTATNFTVANPGPAGAIPRFNGVSPGGGVGGANGGIGVWSGGATPPSAGSSTGGTVKANPWFTQPWSGGAKQAELPYWMKGFPGYGRS